MLPEQRFLVIKVVKHLSSMFLKLIFKFHAFVAFLIYLVAYKLFSEFKLSNGLIAHFLYRRHYEGSCSYYLSVRID